MEVQLREAKREIEEVKKCNAELEYHVTKREGDLKLKIDELNRKDHALATFTQDFEDQLDEAKWDIKLREKRMVIITKAYEDLVSQAVGQFDTGVDAGPKSSSPPISRSGRGQNCAICSMF